jgi:hypothetical protein
MINKLVIAVFCLDFIFATKPPGLWLRGRDNCFEALRVPLESIRELLIPLEGTKRVIFEA